MSLSLNDFYVLVDTRDKIVTSKVQKLPEYWSNITNLSSLNDEELLDLTWAGHQNLGWISITSEYLEDYNSSQENLEMNKNELKYLISKIKEDKEHEGIVYNGIIFKIDQKSLIDIFFKKEQVLKNKDKDFYIKINFTYHKFTSGQIVELYDILENAKNKLETWERIIFKKIDDCKKISDFLYLNYGF